MVFSAGPCEAWTAADCTDWPDDLVAIQADALMAATEILWEKTQKRFGLCSYTLRPCAQDCAGELALAWLYGSWLPTWGMASGGFGWPYPALVGGTWYNLGCGNCQNTCSCNILHQIELPYPVSAVTQVKVDGDILAPTAYRVDDWRYLVRLDGGTWPRCNDLNKADTEDGTWSVTATYGEAVPTLGAFAVNEMALRIARTCVTSCATPSGVVTQIDRQGVRKTLDKGLMGPVATEFVETYNPTRSGVATIINLDRPAARRVGT